MGKKFKTAEEYLALPVEERQAIIAKIARQGYDVNPWDYIDLEDKRELYKKLQDHYERLEKVAYAIGNELREFDGETEHDLDDTLHEFMYTVAEECEQQYCGEYYGHNDGFWIPSNC
jgi:iron uptake system EfeUOB component EfeO/EfeM